MQNRICIDLDPGSPFFIIIQGKFSFVAAEKIMKQLDVAVMVQPTREILAKQTAHKKRMVMPHPETPHTGVHPEPDKIE